MRAVIPAGLAHPALKIAFPLYCGSVITGDISDRHWSLSVASWTLLVVAIILLTLGGLHSYTAPCSHCRAKTPKQLKRWYYRAIPGFRRWAGPPLTVLVIIGFILSPMIIGDKTKMGGRTFDWTGDAIRMGIELVLVAFFAAVRFDQVNFPDRPRKEHVTEFVREHGKKVMHRAHWVYAISFIPMAITSFGPTDGVWGSLGSFSTVVMVGASFVNQQHGMSLCEECVSDFRPDSAEYAEKRGWRFTAVHKYAPPIVLVGLLAVGAAIFLHRPTSSYLLVSYFVLAGSFALLVRFHGSYRPWCPYCRRGGGGDSASEDVPDPSTNQPVPA
jgi:hypothetical protein